jgi:hypothetical protein
MKTTARGLRSTTVEPAGTLQPLWRALELLGAATSIAITKTADRKIQTPANLVVRSTLPETIAYVPLKHSSIDKGAIRVWACGARPGRIRSATGPR